MPQDALNHWQVHIMVCEERSQRMPKVVPSKPALVVLRNHAGLHCGWLKMALRGYTR